MKGVVPVLAAGTAFVTIALAGLLAGILAGQRTGQPLWAFGGLFGGLGAGGYVAVRLLLRSL